MGIFQVLMRGSSPTMTSTEGPWNLENVRPNTAYRIVGRLAMAIA
jgi:hypothetical protein